MRDCWQASIRAAYFLYGQVSWVIRTFGGKGTHRMESYVISILICQIAIVGQAFELLTKRHHMAIIEALGQASEGERGDFPEFG